MDKLIAFLCVFMYFASPYRFLGHAMPEIIGLIAIAMQFVKKGKVSIKYGYGLFLFYMLICPPLLSYATNLPGNYLASFIPTSIVLYSVILCFLLPNLNLYYVLRFYKVLVYLSIAFFFIQEISFYSIGSRLTFYLPLEMYYEGSDVSSFSESRAFLDRSSSFFLEPSHFAQYILPYYCISCYKCINNKLLSIEFLLISLVLLLLQSGAGLLGMMTILISIIFLSKSVPLRVKIGIITLIVSFVVFIVIFFINNPIVVDLLSRVDEVTTLEVEASGKQSGFLRIWRGYFIYNNLESVYKLFGVGVGSIEYVSNLIYIPGSRYEGSYMNGIQTLLVSGGIIGTLLFFRYLYLLCRNMSSIGITIIICMIAMFFIEHMLFTPKMFLYILVSCSISKVDIINFKYLHK